MIRPSELGFPADHAPMNYDTPADLGFPGERFPHWRLHQREAIGEIAKQLSDSYNLVSLSGPTGTGKSLIGCAVAKELRLRALILVGTKQLASQYEMSFPESVVVMKGRSNYPCYVYPHLTADIAPCTMGDQCPVKFSKCPYYLAKKRALGADIVAMPYAYALNELNYIGKMRRPFVILDESHRTERELMSWVNISINKKLLGKYGIQVPSLKGFTRWKEWAMAILPKVSDVLAKLAAQAQSFNWDKSFMKDYQRLDRVYKEVGKLSELNETWLEEYKPWSVKFKPVWVSKYAYPYLFKHGQKFLLMSATPPFPEVLGIGEHGSLEVQSTFPVASRPLINLAVVKLNRKTLESQLPRVVQECDKILDRHFAEGQKGIIHSVSYKIRDYLLAYSRWSEYMITHGRADRSEVLGEFMAAEGPKVLVSPSMSEGVSFDDDRARFAIQVKTPFPSLADPQIRARANESKRWYQYQTCMNIVQTTGRTTRSPTDWSVNYMLDGHLGWLVNKYRDYFPQWFKDAIVWRKKGSS